VWWKRIDQHQGRRTAVKRKRILWIALPLLVIILAGGYYYYANFTSSGDTSQGQETQIQEAVARIGDISVSVSGSGEFVPVSTTALAFQDPGQLLEINVKIGDEVQEGQVLARMRVNQTAAGLAAELAKAELEVLHAQQNLDQLFEDAQLAAAQSLLAVEQAQLAVDRLEDNALEQAQAQQAVSLAEEAVQQAEMNLYIVNSSPSLDAVNTAYASLLFKEKELNEIKDQISQTEYQFKSAPDKMARDRLDQQLLDLRVQLAKQQLEYENALYKYNTLDDPPEEIDVTVAEAQLSTAQLQLIEAQSNFSEVQLGPRESDLSMAQAQLAEAQAEWERLEDGPEPDDIALAEALLIKAEIKLALAQQAKLVLDLVAPLDGTVLSIDANVGDRINNNTVITLADLSQPSIEVTLDEIDLSNVQLGYQAEVVFDAIPGTTFSGQIVELDPSLIRVGNNQALRALVQLDEMPNDLIKLPLGLNAGVDIIAGEATNAILVPLEALHQGDDDSYFVYVVEGEAIEPRPVTVGLTDVTSAAILTGLQQSERVVLGTPELDQE
jgi:multidrug efflux pump subunit AcrA (membrane-fusion protein)